MYFVLLITFLIQMKSNLINYKIFVFTYKINNFQPINKILGNDTIKKY